MTLRAKFILALLISSLASVALVGGVAYYQLSRKFDDTRRQESFLHFQNDIAAYLQTYGSWENAVAHEPFGRFSDDLHRDHAVGAMPPESIPQEAIPQGTNPPGSMPADAGPPPGGMPGNAPDQPFRRQPPPRFQLPLEQEADAMDDDEGPPQAPFRFVLLAPDYRVLLAVPPYVTGQLATVTDQALATPVRVGGKVVAYALPAGRPILSAMDRGYLGAMRAALLAGLCAATVLALLLGVGLGSVLSRTLRQLTDAALAMKAGTLRQRVDVYSADEVGVLAGAFNSMSEELTNKHEELLRTNATIREQAEMLRELSIRDPLTQLYNRRHFDEYAARMHAEAQRYKHPLSAVLGDIDHFKQINDNYSHATGDVVLQKIADLLRQHSRASDVVARYGGEEFVMMLAETALPQAAHVCEQLRLAVENFNWGSIVPGLRVTISLGICDNTGRDEVQAMLGGADKALYEAKDAGRNSIRVAAPLTVAEEVAASPARR